MPLAWGAAGLSGETLATLAAIGGLTLTALYIVGRRPRRVVVPFLALWVPTGSDWVVPRWARRLQKLGSLLLQLTILSLILLAAGDPAINARSDSGVRSIVILIDRSASMQATDEPGSRLLQAQIRARAIIDTLGPGAQALVAAFATDVVAVSAWDSDHGRLKAAVDSIAASDQPGDPRAARAFATALLRGQPNPTLIVIGDAADGGDASVGVSVQFVPVGRRRDNVGFVAFSARRLPADPSSIQLVAVTQNFKAAPVEITVAITGGAARTVITRQAIRLAPSARVVTTVPAVITPETRFEAVIENARDDLTVDDRAYAVVPTLPPLSVLVVGNRNLYLEGALLGMAAGVRVDHVAATKVEQSRARWPGYDVLIFDGVTPQAPPETGHHLYLDPHGPGSPWPERGPVRDPVVTDVKRDHPLVKQLALSDLNVETARRLTLKPGDVAVATAAETPLIIARERPNLRQVAIAFDVRRSDLPLRSAFPLLIANTLTWLAQRAAAPSLSFATGGSAAISIPHSSAMAFVDVVMPDGRTLRSPVAAGSARISLNQVGIVKLLDPAGRAIVEVAVNLASPSESDTAPPVLAQGQPRASDGAGRHASRELGLAALVIALGLATLEWVTFHRRTTV